jgi:hypothetical protein
MSRLSINLSYVPVGSLTSHIVLFSFHGVRTVAFSNVELIHALNHQTLGRTFGWGSARRNASTNVGYKKQGTKADHYPRDKRV